MKRVARFEKISWTQFQKDYINTFGEDKIINIDDIRKIYDGINIPMRATIGSAGYDFQSPMTFSLPPRETIKLPTGIRTKIDDGWVLKIYPRSNLGFNYRLQLDNSVGIIDSDYYFSNNEGHIFIKITNDTHQNKIVSIRSGDKFAQGVFVEYGITYDDNVYKIRNDGFGSTNLIKN